MAADVARGHGGGAGRPYVVCTGGEPLLQLDGALVDALHRRGFEVAVETNGTLAVPAGIDWVCVSPKAGADLVRDRGRRAQAGLPAGGGRTVPVRAPRVRPVLPAAHGRRRTPWHGANTAAAVAYCLAHPQWRLSVQTHKYLGIP